MKSKETNEIDEACIPKEGWTNMKDYLEWAVEERQRMSFI